MTKFDFIEAALDRRRKGRLYRNLRDITPLSASTVLVDGNTMVNVCSNDYLGIARHPLLRERAIEFAECYGTGSTASRLICGSMDCFAAIEAKLANLKRTEAAMIFNSGFQANLSVIPALADPRTLVLSDELNHNSIIQGVILARCAKRLFRHNDLAHLEARLEGARRENFSRIIIVTESVFSMDGDRTDIERLVDLADAYGAITMVDEAHATGVLGESGMGLSVGKGVDITLGTFGKALGSFGAYIACATPIREYLVNCCSGFIYTTALPPPNLGAIDAALDLVPTMTEARTRLQDNAGYLRRMLQQSGYDTGKSSTQIVPVILGDEQATLTMSRRLEAAGFLATAIRPPTVPQGESRIRVALSAAHCREQIDRLIEAFR